MILLAPATFMIALPNLADVIGAATIPQSGIHQIMAPPTTNHRIVGRAFLDWQAGRGSFYDLITDDGSVTIAGQSPHSGMFSKAAFLRERAKPFQARFSTPILPTDWKIWAVADQVIVRWESKATACDGKPYTNSYAYFITMKDGRATALTMFLDMAMFDDVWNRCRPVDQNAEGKR